MRISKNVSWGLSVALLFSASAVRVAGAQAHQPDADAGTSAAKAPYPKYRITEINAPSGAEVLIGTGGRPLDAAGDVVYMLGSDAYLWNSDGSPTIDITTSGARKSTTTNALDINASGQVAGWAEFGAQVHAFLWKNDGTAMMDLGALGSAGNPSQAVAINDLGQVAGTSGGNRAFLWKNDGGPMRNLGTLAGGTSSTATALNESGQVTGWATTKATGNGTPHAFLWKNDGTPMVDLGPFRGKASYGLSINASGEVSGFAWASVVNNVTHYHAYRWRNDGTAPVDLDKSGGAHDSRGDKINDAGQVIGSAWSTAANAYHAFTWRSNGTAVDLGTLGGTRSEANDINRAGWVVGTSTVSAANNSYYNAFLWIDNGQGTKNLNDLVDPADPLKSQVVLSNAFAINDAGDIAVVGTNGHLYLLRGSHLALDPPSLAFGNQAVGSSSAAKTVNVQNRTDSVVPITSIRLAGTAAGQFSYTSNCGSAVVANGKCAIKVTFKPTTKGAKSATLSVNGGGNGLRVVGLSGKGT